MIWQIVDNRTLPFMNCDDWTWRGISWSLLWFVCFFLVFFWGKMTMNASIWMGLPVSPSIRQYPPEGEASVVEGADLDLTCLVDGRPEPQVVWKFQVTRSSPSVDINSWSMLVLDCQSRIANVATVGYEEKRNPTVKPIQLRNNPSRTQWKPSKATYNSIQPNETFIRNRFNLVNW